MSVADRRRARPLDAQERRASALPGRPKAMPMPENDTDRQQEASVIYSMTYRY
jgi:hypothetical protein